MNLRALFYDALRAVPVYPRRPAFAVFAAVAVGVAYIWVTANPVILQWAVLACAVITGWWFFREVLPAQTTKGTVTRRGDREQRAGGVASIWDVQERASRADLRRRAGILRPSLRGARRRRINPWSIGVLVARTGWGLRFGQEVWSSCEETTLRVGGPRTGKTIALAAYGLDAPGSLLTTSTRLDLAEAVHSARMGRSVHVFNPTGYGSVPSTVYWSILVGCEDYATAARRVTDMIPESPSAEGERWDSDARLYLPVLFHAAAMSGRELQILRWLRDIATDETADRAQREIVNILARDPQADERIGLLRQFVSTTSKTRSGILKSMAPALAWMSDDTARSIGAAPVERITLDIPRLIREGETLHIIGPDQSTSLLAPLTSALVAEIAWQARMVAADMPSGRLDPPATFLLDEAAVSVRLPLPEWTADLGGRGVTLHISVQSLSQLETCWGTDGAGTLLGNINTLILYGGGKDAVELRKISDLCGSRWRRVVNGGEDIDGDGEKWEKVPVLTTAQLSNMPAGEAAVLKRGLGGVVVGRTPTVLDRRKWRPMSLTPPVPADEPEPAAVPVPTEAWA